MAQYGPEVTRKVLELIDTGKSQGEVSKITGVSQPTISRMVKQRHNSAQVSNTPVTSPDTTITVTDAELSAHPLANLFPLMNDADFAALQDDIAKQGLLEPLWLHEGQILDGRNRYKACKALGIQPQVRTYQGTDPLGFVLSMNLVRRHLNESQRAMVATDVATMRQGERTDLQPSANLQKVSQAKASELFNISARSVSDAKKVKAEAQPEVVNAVRGGHLAVSAAAKLALKPGPVQRQVAAKVVSGEASTVTQALKLIQTESDSPQSHVHDDLKKLMRLHEQIMLRWRTADARRAILDTLDMLTHQTRDSLGPDKEDGAHD
jgi:predicted XRE-type DNA-binding protein